MDRRELGVRAYRGRRAFVLVRRLLRAAGGWIQTVGAVHAYLARQAEYVIAVRVDAGHHARRIALRLRVTHITGVAVR